MPAFLDRLTARERMTVLLAQDRTMARLIMVASSKILTAIKLKQPFGMKILNNSINALTSALIRQMSPTGTKQTTCLPHYANVKCHNVYFHQRF